MAELTNMKLPPPKAKTEAECAPCSTMPREDYPYGLRLHLDTTQLEQIGIDKLPQVGTEVHLVAKAKITGVNEGASEHDKKTYRNVALQITDLGLGAAGKSKKDTKSVLYGDGED